MKILLQMQGVNEQPRWRWDVVVCLVSENDSKFRERLRGTNIEYHSILMAKYHRLRGSASTVLTATKQVKSMDTGQIWPPYRIETPQPIAKKSAQLITSARGPRITNLVEIQVMVQFSVPNSPRYFNTASGVQYVGNNNTQKHFNLNNNCRTEWAQIIRDWVGE